jgi:hypothetical protein
MEEDVNVIIDVEPAEAELLIGLIETLFEDWYVDREEKQKRNAALADNRLNLKSFLFARLAPVMSIGATI